MGRLVQSRGFLYMILFLLVGLSVVERIRIGGDILHELWWLLMLFPILHTTLHIIYLVQIHHIKLKQLGVIALSHFGYFLFFIFQFDKQDGYTKVILPEIVHSYSVNLSLALYHLIIPHWNLIILFSMISYVLFETLFAIRLRKYIKTEAVVLS